MSVILNVELLVRLKCLGSFLVAAFTATFAFLRVLVRIWLLALGFWLLNIFIWFLLDLWWLSGIEERSASLDRVANVD